MVRLETRTPEQLSRTTSFTPAALITIQEPGGPVQSIEARSLLRELYNADVVYETRAELFADLGHDPNSIGLVTADPTLGNSGYYQKSGASGVGAWTLIAVDTLALRTELSEEDGAAMVGLDGGDNVQEFATATKAATSLVTSFRDDPAAAFAVLPLKARAVHGRGQGAVSMSESPTSYAKRTNLVVTDPPLFVDPVYGSDANDGVYARPKKTLTAAGMSSDSGTSDVWCAGGTYEEGLNLVNTGPLANRIRIFRALGTCILRCPRDDLTSKDVKATGQIAFGGLPTAGEYFTLGGFVFTFRAAVVVPTDVLIGADAAATAINTAAALNRLSILIHVTALAAGANVNLTSTLYGALGNAISLTEAATNTTVSGAALAGGADTWTAGASNTWSFNLNPANPPPRAVLDMRMAGPDGQGFPLAQYASLAALQGFGARSDNMGGWYYDSATNKLWVRRGTVSIEAYRANLRMVTAVAVGTPGVHLSRLYMQDVAIAFVGDWRFEGVYLESRSIAGRAKLFLDLNSDGAVNASFSNLGFLETAGSYSIVKGVIGQRSADDMFHYNKDGGPAGGWAQEIDCKSRLAGDYDTFGGATPFTTNASSIHDDYVIGRYGCDYSESYGIVGADVGTGAALSIGCRFSVAGAGNSISYLSEVPAWLDSCDVVDSTTDLQAQNGGAIHTFSTVYRTSAVPSGTIAAFVPTTDEA